MNSKSEQSDGFNKSLIQKVIGAVFVLIVIYAVAQPRLNEWFNLGLPGLPGTQQEQLDPNQQAKQDDRTDNPGNPPRKVGVDQEKSNRQQTDSAKVDNRFDPIKSNGDPTTKSANPQLGEMREIRNNVFQSTAGLVYTPGSVDGHRRKHVLAHARDKPSRPIHGVFDVGGEKDVFALLDEAYLLIKKKSPQVKVNRNDGRSGTSYDVNMKRRIGYIGGESGGRSRNPAANYVRMVLEDNRVITAFPIRK